jgi:hypothetical protein
MMHESAMGMGPGLDPSGQGKLAHDRHENETADTRW